MSNDQSVIFQVIDPLTLDDEQWDAIHATAKRLSIEYFCGYDKALILAFLELNELATSIVENGEVKH